MALKPLATAGVGAVMASLPDLLVDFPKAEAQLVDMCGQGLVRGTLKEGAFASTGMGIPGHDAAAQRDRGYVDVAYVAPAVAAKLPGAQLVHADDASGEK